MQKSKVSPKMPVARNSAVEGNVFARLCAILILEAPDVAAYHEVGLAGGERIGLQFLSEDVHLHLFAALTGYFQDAVLGNGQDATRAAGSVVYMIGVVRNLVSDGQHGQVGQRSFT